MSYFLSNTETYSDAITEITKKIESLNKDLDLLKQRDEKLIIELIDTFFEYENPFDKNKPKKLIGRYDSVELIKAKMAFCYASSKIPASSWCITINIKKKYISRDNEVRLPYWFVSQCDWYSYNSSLIFKKKDLKQMLPNDFDYKKIWLKLVNKEKVTLGYDAWLKEVSNDDLLAYLLNTNKSKNRNYNVIYIRSIPKLKLKDYVVFLPTY